jgi:uncharacterized protein YqjF (DUF2071 family)
MAPTPREVMPGERALPAWVNSLRARAHFEDTANRPLLLADWKRAVFLHYEVDPAVLQKCVPYDLDLLDGRAYVSFVAFTLERMPVSTFLTVRLFEPSDLRRTGRGARNLFLE